MVTLGALAALDVISANLKADAGIGQGFKIVKMKYTMSWRNNTTLEGPIVWGLAKGPIDAAEIEEALEADPQGEVDIPAAEFAVRKVFPMGMIPASGTVNGGLEMMPMRSIRFPWKTVRDDESIAIWHWNLGAATLTTGWLVVYFFTFVVEWE